MSYHSSKTKLQIRKTYFNLFHFGVFTSVWGTSMRMKFKHRQIDTRINFFNGHKKTPLIVTNILMVGISWG